MNIRQIFFFALSVATAAFSTPALAADVGVSISVGQPGFYGRIDIGDYPVPAIVYPHPVIVHRSVVEYEPIFLRVPPGHAKRWSHYCGRYSACGYPVYFVEDGWYHDIYVPHYRERHGVEHDRHDRGGRDRGRGERRDRRGNGQGKGHGRD